MKHYLAGVAMLLVLSLALFLVETHRQWGLIIFLLALIFYALFANPWKHAHTATFGKKKKTSFSRKGVRKKAR